MKKIKIFNLHILLTLIFLSWNCSEDPLFVELNESNLIIDTLTLSEISAFNYFIPPNIGSSDKLYLGTKSGFDIPYSLINIDSVGKFTSNTGIKWSAFLDSSITLSRIDSIHFKLFSDDSLIEFNSNLNLYLNLDFLFSEDTSTYLNVNEELISEDWIFVGSPLFKYNNDTSGNYIRTELVWDLKNFDSLLVWDNTDILNEKKSRVFAISSDSDTSFIELLSRESSTGSTDPKINVYYRQNIILEEDSTYSDTSLSATFYADEDVSIINPTSFIQENPLTDSLMISINNGSGSQSIIQIPFDSYTLPSNAIIRNAVLKLPLDTIRSDSGHQIIFNPVSKQLAPLDSDPYLGLGVPYRVSSITDGSSIFQISLKSFLQDVIYNKQTNMGFKIISNISNDPFKSIFFNLSDLENKPKIEITYVKP
jgi:hypothetical protein